METPPCWPDRLRGCQSGAPSGLTKIGRGSAPAGRSGEILRANILTRFNLILGVLMAVILAVGQLQDALFGIVLVANALIGIAQELRAKRHASHRLAVDQRSPGPGDPRRRAAGDS